MREAYKATQYRPEVIVRRTVRALGPKGKLRSYRVYEIGADHRTYREWDAYPPDFDAIPGAVRAAADGLTTQAFSHAEWPL
jgi:hypothetical protein